MNSIWMHCLQLTKSTITAEKKKKKEKKKGEKNAEAKIIAIQTRHIVYMKRNFLNS